MLEHIHKTNSKNEELNKRFKGLKTQENEIRNRLDEMTTENNNVTMRLNQKVEQLEKENGSLLHDISSIPEGSPSRTRQDEINELNEFDNVSQKSVNKYIKRVDQKVKSHNDEINAEFERMQERLKEHFKFFANNVRDKFEREVIQVGINQEFEKLSPIKQQNESYDENDETGEDSRISGINERDE